MGASRNRVGSAYALTTFAPVIPGHEDELRAYIDSLPMGADSPLALAIVLPSVFASLAFSRVRVLAPGDAQVDAHPLGESNLVFVDQDNAVTPACPVALFFEE